MLVIEHDVIKFTWSNKRPAKTFQSYSQKDEGDV